MRLNDIKKAFLASAALLSAMSMGAAERFVSFQQGDLLINGNDKVEIYMDANDCRGVSYAANALVKDISKVSGSQATITSNRKATILVGTIGHSAAIDQLVKQKRINGNLLIGNDIRRDKFAACRIVKCGNGRVLYTVKFADNLLDLRKLYSKASYLDLRVASADKLNRAIGQKSYNVACVVYLSESLLIAERIFRKCLCCLFGTV